MGWCWEDRNLEKQVELLEPKYFIVSGIVRAQLKWSSFPMWRGLG